MNEFERLKNSYIAAVQWGLSVRVGHNESKRGNEILHKFIENLIDNSNYTDPDRASMKHELEIIKETHDKEIDSFYKKF